jgi:predicted metal-binding membrane protein
MDAMPMHGMPMPGGWTLSMLWMRMPSQTWPGAAAAFVGMWLGMMVPMMLPVLVPALWRHHRTTRAGIATLAAGAGYFAVWAVVGVVVFAMGAVLAAVAMRETAVARAAPVAFAVVVLVAGACQLSRWKARRLARCHDEPACRATSPGAAWRYGLRLGVHCVACCGNLMVALLAFGVMDVRAMVAVTAAIAAERLLPAGVGVARMTGVVMMAGAVVLLVRRMGFD